MSSGAYGTGFAITWFLTFVVTWIICWFQYGFLLGFGLGWLPAAILATIVGALWPLLALVLIVGAAIIFFMVNKG